MTLDRDGAEHFGAAVISLEPLLAKLFAEHPPAAAGTRTFESPCLRDVLTPMGPIAQLAARLLGPLARPVRAILFDKNAAVNWGLGWHQDRVIAVRSRIDVAGFGPWSVKRGVHHVAPPWPVLSAMRTLRVHLDAVPADNAPLLVVPGSHRLGIVVESDVAELVERMGSRACLAAAGDVWAYATPILHASAPSTKPRHRRVLQLDYSAGRLPGGLDYYGV
ncbi:MAG: phytanoyl-CoA dioxygenase family protein [Sphingomonas bacterium]|nr:phytanoyl-CoA dioxygenase family protein [Sphingomonas bacterium]